MVVHLSTPYTLAGCWMHDRSAMFILEFENPQQHQNNKNKTHSCSIGQKREKKTVKETDI